MPAAIHPHGAFPLLIAPLVWALTSFAVPTQSAQVELVDAFGKGIVTSSVISPDGGLVAVVASASLLVLDGPSLELRHVLTTEPPSIIDRAAFDSAGSRVAAVLHGGEVSVWDLRATPLEQRVASTEDPSLVDFVLAAERASSDERRLLGLVGLSSAVSSPSGRYVAGVVSSDAGGQLEVWDTQSSSRVLVVASGTDPPWRRFSADERFLVLGTYDRVGAQVIELRSGKIVPYGSLALAELASCGLSLMEYQLARIEALRDDYAFSGRPLKTELLRMLPEPYVEWARRWVISSGMRSCDAMPPPVEASYRDQWHDLPRLAFAYGRTDRIWAIAISEGQGVPPSTHGIQFWDNDTHERLATLEAHRMSSQGAQHETLRYVHDLAFSPDGRYLLSAGEDRTVRLWDVPTRTLLATVEGHLAPVRAVAFAPDGARFLSGSEDGTLRLWRVVDGRSTAP